MNKCRVGDGSRCERADKRAPRPRPMERRGEPQAARGAPHEGHSWARHEDGSRGKCHRANAAFWVGPARCNGSCKAARLDDPRGPCNPPGLKMISAFPREKKTPPPSHTEWVRRPAIQNGILFLRPAPTKRWREVRTEGIPARTEAVITGEMASGALGPRDFECQHSGWIPLIHLRVGGRFV